MLRSISFSLLALGALPVVVACDRPAAPAAEVRIGVVAPYSRADFEADWRPIREGVELAAREIEARGGVEVAGRRHRLRLIFADNADQPDTTVEAVRRLVNEDRVVALIGPVISRNALVMATVAENAGVPMITPTASNPEVTAGKSWVFRLTFTDDFLGRALATFAHQELGARRGAALYDVASAYNRDVVGYFREEFERRGGRMVAAETYTTGEIDFVAALERIHAAAPEVLLLPNYVTEVIVQASQARRIGIAATLLGGDSWDGDRFAPLPDFDGSYLVADWHIAVADERAQTFIADYRAAYGRLPRSGAALGYDAVGILREAIEGGGELGPAAIRDGLRRLEGHHGVSGTIAFRGHGDPVKSLLILGIRDGELAFHRRIAPRGDGGGS